MDGVAVKREVDPKRVRDILGALALPSEIESVETNFELDASGDPAVYVTLTVRKGAHLTKQDIVRLTNFTTEITNELISADLPLFPYVNLQQAA